MYEYEWASVLMLWRSPEKAAAYLVTLLADHPSYWGVLASIALRRAGDGFELNLAPLRELLALRQLASIKNPDVEALSPAARNIALAFVRELQVVPALAMEVESVRVCAQALVDLTPSAPPAISWEMPEWSSARPRIEPILKEEPWWPELIRVFENFEQARTKFSTLPELTSPEAAVSALAVASELQALGRSIREGIGEVIEPLANAVGAQTPIRFSEG